MDPGRKAAVTSNATFVRPEKFYISWFADVPSMRYFFGLLCLVYIVTVIGNVSLLTLIYRSKALHTAKYIIISHLAITDLCESTAFIPRILDIQVSNRRYIVYETCITSMFFVYFFGSVQCWTLVTLAYDRLIAICFPLKYHSVVTKKSVCVMLLIIWVALIGLGVHTIRLVDDLSFCGSIAIPSFFCDYTATISLACNDRTQNNIMLIVGSAVHLFGPLAFIGLTYFCIAVALIRIASAQERLKAMKTCTSHLILVIVFFLPITVTTISILAGSIHPYTKTANACLTFTVPALLNPIVYSLKTEEVLSSIRKIFRKPKVQVGKALTGTK